MPTGDVNRNELGEFLKARRTELTPSDMGLPDPGGPRRVKGLRREEVAQLASISVDYYARLEQGRIAASAPYWPPSPGRCGSTRMSALTSTNSPARALHVPADGARRSSAHPCGESSTN